MLSRNREHRFWQDSHCHNGKQMPKLYSNVPSLLLRNTQSEIWCIFFIPIVFRVTITISLYYLIPNSYQHFPFFSLTMSSHCASCMIFSFACRHWLQVCRALYNASSSDTLWRRLYTKHFVVISPEIHSVAEDIGWKKTFLMSRLKLQAVQTRRRVTMEQQGQHLNKTANEERKKLTLVM